jgi:hypothetical protein
VCRAVPNNGDDTFDYMIQAEELQRADMYRLCAGAFQFSRNDEIQQEGSP